MPYYAVKEGNKPGIYETWDECKKQVDGYSGAKYKKFNNIDDAKDFIGATKTVKFEEPIFETSIDTKDIDTSKYTFYVDGSYNNKTKVVGYGLVLIKDGQIILRDMGTSHSEEDVFSRNVLGELKGAIKAMDLAVANGYKEITIFYDYEGIGKWATGAWKAKKDLTKHYKDIYNQRSKYVKINFKKVKGHSGDAMNDEADRLSKIGSGVL